MLFYNCVFTGQAIDGPHNVATQSHTIVDTCKPLVDASTQTIDSSDHTRTQTAALTYHASSQTTNTTEASHFQHSHSTSVISMGTLQNLLQVFVINLSSLGWVVIAFGSFLQKLVAPLANHVPLTIWCCVLLHFLIGNNIFVEFRVKGKVMHCSSVGQMTDAHGRCHDNFK